MWRGIWSVASQLTCPARLCVFRSVAAGTIGSRWMPNSADTTLVCRELTAKKTRHMLARDMGLGEKGLDDFKAEVKTLLDKARYLHEPMHARSQWIGTRYHDGAAVCRCCSPS